MMRNRILWLFLVVLVALPLSGESWYVRPDGGTRYSANAKGGQCDGKADAPYRGQGTNQHCAFKDYRYLWDDQSWNGYKKWVIAGGDTVIVRGGPWRVGFNQGKDSHDVWCAGGGDPYACFNPPIPAGTASQHTRILGENYATCSNPNGTDRSKLTPIFGGFAVTTALNLTSTQFVDVSCFEITRHSECVRHGDPMFPSHCNSSYPLDDYDSDGIITDNHTANVTLTDLWIHGHTDRGIIGPIGGPVTCLRCDIGFNGMAGWDFDDGHSTPFGPGAEWNFIGSIIEWNGCNQEYPITHPVPAISCYGQSSGGYGDGVGTPAGTGSGMSVNVDHSIFRYNTQDGLDLLHMDAGTHSLTITNSFAQGNNGASFKWGQNFQTVKFANNVALDNCARLSAPFPGAPDTYNKHLGDFCRAEDAILMTFAQGGNTIFINNTIVSYAPTTIDIACFETSCSNSTLIFKNNILYGYDNPRTYELGGKPGGPGGFYSEKPIGNFVRSNNTFYGIRGLRCITLPRTEHCDDPKFVTAPHLSKEQDLDNFNFHLAQGSPAIHSGANIPELRNDFEGKPRPTGPYSLGAIEY